MISEKYGKVIKGLGGLWEVRIRGSEGIERLACRAKGVLRRDDEKLLVGDEVRVTIDDSTPDGVVISELLPRRNSLIRPPLSNLDYLFIVFAAAKPAPVIETVDKLIAIAEHNSITPVIVITKSDLQAEAAEEYLALYRSVGLSAFVTSSEDGSGLSALCEYIKREVRDGRTAAFAGASGVGKSTLMNALFPSLALATGDIDALAVAYGNGEALVNDTIVLSDYYFEVEEKYKNNVILLNKEDDALLAKVNAALAKAMEEDLYDTWYEACQIYAEVKTLDELGYDDEGNKITE